MRTYTTSLESLLARFRQKNVPQQFTADELERLITNGQNIGMTPAEVQFARTTRHIMAVTAGLARQAFSVTRR